MSEPAHQPVASTAPVMQMHGVSKRFERPRAAPLEVLSDIDLTLAEGEIVGLLGRSGSGKSTLLRIAAGLIEATGGEVRYRGVPLRGPTEGIAMVFQSFALYPWLTVQKNVELGLEASRLKSSEIERRAHAAIDLIGLDGFQSAYPRELSGGMRQRVGFARAIVGDPWLLLMDEPFSALDVLTAENLRTDFLDLWVERRLTTRSVLMVTHNIEEAVLMCDRIIVLGAHPAHVLAEVAVHLPRPRDRLAAAFQGIVADLYSELTSRMSAAVGLQRGRLGVAVPLPDATVNEIGGLLERLLALGTEEPAALGSLASALGLEANRLLPVVAALHLLEFAEVSEDSIKLTAAGRIFAECGTDARKQLFREHLVTFVPYAAHIRQVLEERADRRAPRARFEYELEDRLAEPDADSTLRILIGWGRYAELFAYDDETRYFRIEKEDV